MVHIRCPLCNGKVVQRGDIYPFIYKRLSDDEKSSHRLSWCCKECYVSGWVEESETHKDIIEWNTVIQDEPNFEKHLNIMYSIIELIWNGNIDF